jgi:hypothetical protein
MAHPENIVAYWQSARPYVENSRIDSHTQEILYLNGRASYLGLIIGAFAAERATYTGVSSALPQELMERRDSLEAKGIELLSVTAPSTELVSRFKLRQTLEVGKEAVEAALLDGAHYLPTTRYLSAEGITPNTGRLYIPSDDETIPDDLLRMIDEAVPVGTDITP